MEWNWILEEYDDMVYLCDKDATLPRRSLHIGSQVQTRGVSALCEVDRGMIRQAGGNGCARLQRASASSGVAAPQGCANEKTKQRY